MRVRQVRPSVFMPDYGPTLTLLERSVLQAMANGRTARECADNCSYSEDHIKGVLKDINRKLGARNKTHAVAIAWRAGLLS